MKIQMLKVLYNNCMKTDYTIALLAEKDCSDCMRCNGYTIDRMENTFILYKIWTCRKWFKKIESTEICERFIYKYNVWSRVYYNMRGPLLFIIILNLMKYIILFKPISIVLDITAICINILISYLLNKRFIKKAIYELEK